jgi:O-antigen/teichoic acid export membrane protein
MAGKSSWNLFNTIFSAGLGVGLGLVLIPRYGVVGAAIAAAATVAANNLIPLAQVWGYLRLHPLGRGFLIVASSALFAYGIGGTLTRLLLGSTPVALAVASVLGTIVYVALLRRSREVLRFDVIRDVVRARGRRGGTEATPAS